MSQVASTSIYSTTFETIFTAALDEYKEQTKIDIASHPLATQLQSCDSSSAIIALLKNQFQTIDKRSDERWVIWLSSQGLNEGFDEGFGERWTKWLDPTVNVLFAFSATLRGRVGVVN